MGQEAFLEQLSGLHLAVVESAFQRGRKLERLAQLEFGFGGLGLSAEDFEEPDVVVQLGREPQRIDILTFATGLTFSDAFDHRMMLNIGGLQVPFLSIDDLRTNKLATGRLQDKADAAHLPPPDEVGF